MKQGHTIQSSTPCHPYGSWMDKVIWRWCALYEIYGEQEVWQPSRLLQVDNKQRRKIGVDGCRQRQTERRTMNGARSVSESSRPSCLTPPATFHAQWLTPHTWLWSVNHPVCNDLCSQIHVMRYSSLKKPSPQIGCNLKFDQDFEACWSFCCVDRAQFNYKTQCLGSVMALAMFLNGVNTSWSSIWCHL